MSLDEILDRLERMNVHLTNRDATDDYRIYQMEHMLDALISHVRDAIERDAASPQHRRPA